MLWPFKDEQAFWEWAMDPYAELDTQDEDVLLYAAEGLHLLVAAADRPDCPKQLYCAFILDDYAKMIIYGRDVAAVPVLRNAVARAHASTHPLTRRWATYVDRLFGYCQPQGPVKRAVAERMAADLLSGPCRQEKMAAGGWSDWLTVQVTSNGKHWQCSDRDSYRHYLYINRRTGAWRRSYSRPLPADELVRL